MESKKKPLMLVLSDADTGADVLVMLKVYLPMHAIAT